MSTAIKSPMKFSSVAPKFCTNRVRSSSGNLRDALVDVDGEVADKTHRLRVDIRRAELELGKLDWPSYLRENFIKCNPFFFGDLDKI